jgi:hypothetical protein
MANSVQFAIIRSGAVRLLVCPGFLSPTVPGHAARARIQQKSGSRQHPRHRPGATPPILYKPLPISPLAAHIRAAFSNVQLKHPRRLKAASDCCAALILCRSGRKRCSARTTGALPVRNKAAMSVAGTDGGNDESVVTRRAVALHENGVCRPASPYCMRAATSGRRLKRASQRAYQPAKYTQGAGEAPSYGPKIGPTHKFALQRLACVRCTAVSGHRLQWAASCVPDDARTA